MLAMKKSSLKKADKLCAEILDLIEQLPDNEAAIEYYSGIETTVNNIQVNIEEFENVTDNQITALENIRDGVLKWLH